MNKPALGIEPYYVHLRKRIIELAQAIERNAEYEETPLSILMKWSQELYILCKAEKDLREKD